MRTLLHKRVSLENESLETRIAAMETASGNLSQTGWSMRIVGAVAVVADGARDRCDAQGGPGRKDR
jgi:hypothetical protein